MSRRWLILAIAAQLLVLAWMAVRRELGALSTAAARKGVLLRLAASAGLVSINWLAFVWGVNEHRVVEVSLGYFINPLVNVLLGILILSERLNRVQWVAVALAAGGVAYLTAQTGSLPWIALTLAMSFGLVASRCSRETICARMRSTAAASKRGSVSASRR